MNKPQIDEEQYVQLINNKMKEHEFYADDMRVELNPRNASFPSGLSMIGGGGVETIVAWATKQVEDNYELILST